MTFDVERAKIEQMASQYTQQLSEQRRAAEEEIRRQARRSLSELEKQKQAALKTLYEEETKARRQAALGAPRVTRRTGIKRTEEEAAQIAGLTKEAQEKALKELEAQFKTAEAEVSKWKTEALEKLAQAEAEFVSKNVQLSTGEWVSREEFAKLTPEQQKQLYELGVEGFNRTLEELQAKLKTEGVQLKTGEWVSKEAYEALSPEHQRLLQEVGVLKFRSIVGQELREAKAGKVEISPGVFIDAKTWDALTDEQRAEILEVGVEEFNRRQREAYEKFLATHVQLGDGQFISKEDFEKLTDIEKQLVLSEGLAAISIEGLKPEEAFKKLQALGRIDKDAIFKGYNPETQEFEYTMGKRTYTPEELAEIERKWLALPEQQQSAMIGSQVKYLEPWKVWGKSPKEIYETVLTPKEKERVLRYYNEVVAGVKTTEDLKKLMKSEIEAWKKFYISLTPVVGTVYFWNEMSPTWRAVSIATDVAFFLPYIRAGIQALKASKAPVTTQAAMLTKAEVQATKQTFEVLSDNLGKKVASSFAKTSEAQLKYYNLLATAIQLQADGKAVTPALKLAISQAEKTLRTTARGFVDDLFSASSRLKGIKDIPVRFDSPELTRLFRNLPDELVRSTQSAAEGLKVTNIKALENAVTAAEAALKAAQAKYPTDSSKWIDLVRNLNEAQTKLALARTGSANAVYEKLLNARAALENARMQGPPSSGLESELMHAAKILRLEQQVSQLESELARTLNLMELEWVAPGSYFGSLSRGAAVTTEVKPIMPPPTVTPLKTAPAAATTAALIAKVLTIPAEVSEIKVEWTPEIVREIEEVAKEMPQIETVSTPEVVSVVEAATRAATEAAVKGMTEPEVKQAALTAAEIATHPLVDTGTITQTQAETLTSTAVKVATKVATHIKTATTPKTLAVRPDEIEEEEKTKMPAQREEGEHVITYTPPKGSKHKPFAVIGRRVPFPGVLTVEVPVEVPVEAPVEAPVEVTKDMLTPVLIETPVPLLITTAEPVRVTPAEYPIEEPTITAAPLVEPEVKPKPKVVSSGLDIRIEKIEIEPIKVDPIRPELIRSPKNKKEPSSGMVRLK